MTGLLDIDYVGVGDPLDDVGALVAHLRFRALTSGDQHIEAYAVTDVLSFALALAGSVVLCALLNRSRWTRWTIGT